MATARLLLGIFSFAFTCSFGMFNSYLLVQDKDGETNCRSEIVKIAAGEVGVREKTGENDGKRVESYLSIVGLHKGDPYCAAYVSWVFSRAGYERPHSGWSPDLFPASRVSKSALPGNVIGIYFANLKRIAHVGIIERTDHDWCSTLEANTNVYGSREGEGVYRRRRHLKTIYRIADWILPGRRSP